MSNTDPTSMVPSGTPQGADTPPGAPTSPPTPSSGLTLLQALVIQALLLPPRPGAPTATASYNVPAGTNLKTLHKATGSQVAHGQGMLGELKNFAATNDWTATFGSVLGTADQILGALAGAVAWSAEQKAADAWAKTASANARVGWDQWLRIQVFLSPILENLLQSHPELATTMPATVAFLGARSASAQQAAQTRAAVKTTQARATKQAANATVTATKARAAEASEAILHPTAPAPTTPPATTAPAPTTAPPGGSVPHP